MLKVLLENFDKIDRYSKFSIDTSSAIDNITNDGCTINFANLIDKCFRRKGRLQVGICVNDNNMKR